MKKNIKSFTATATNDIYANAKELDRVVNQFLEDNDLVLDDVKTVFSETSDGKYILVYTVIYHSKGEGI